MSSPAWDTCSETHACFRRFVGATYDAASCSMPTPPQTCISSSGPYACLGECIRTCFSCCMHTAAAATFWDLHMLGEPLRPALSNVGLIWALLLALLARASTGGASLGGLCGKSTCNCCQAARCCCLQAVGWFDNNVIAGLTHDLHDVLAWSAGNKACQSLHQAGACCLHLPACQCTRARQDCNCVLFAHLRHKAAHDCACIIGRSL